MNGAKLVYCMKKANIGTQELADKVGVSRSYISSLRNGEKSNPTLDIVIKIADVLEVTIDELVKE